MAKPTKGRNRKRRATEGPRAASEARAPRLTQALGRIVYAVILELPADVSESVLRKLRELNPRAVEGRPVVYIGETGLSADKRVYNHCVGRQSSRWVQRYARRLVRLDAGPADFGHPLPSQVLEHIADLAARSVEESKIREKAVAEILRKEGWWVVCA